MHWKLLKELGILDILWNGEIFDTRNSMEFKGFVREPKEEIGIWSKELTILLKPFEFN